MEIKTIIEELSKRNILHIRRGHLSLNSMYKHLLDDSSIKVINDWQSNFRSEKEGWWCLLHNIKPNDRPKCPICGDLAKFTDKGYNMTCGKCNYNNYGPKKEKVKLSTTEESKKKGREKYEKTCLERYGKKSANQFITEEKKKIYIENCQKKYGTNNAGQSKEARKKYEQTMMDRYGVKHNFTLSNTPEHAKKIWDKNHNKIIEKSKKTQLKKYGVEFYCQSPDFKNKVQNTLIYKYGSIKESYKIRKEKSEETKENKYGTKTYNNIEKIKKSTEDRITNFETANNCTRINKLIEDYGQGWYNALNLPIIYDGRFRFIDNKYLNDIIEYASVYHNLHSTSKEEKELLEYIKSLTKETILENKKSIIKDDNHKYELDIYIPSLNLAFEFNGNYWHSDMKLPNDYHQNKTKLCYENKIQLIHIYEFDWKENKDLIKERLRKLFNHEDCSEFNWISIDEYNEYKLTKPSIIYTYFDNKGNKKYNVYNEGKFIKIKSI